VEYDRVCCTETSVTNYHYTLLINPEESNSHPLRGGSLKSFIILYHPEADGAAEMLLLSLIGIREIRQTQIDTLLYSFIVTLGQHVLALSRGHPQAVEEVFIKA
jgi:hypothetical protein